MDRKANSHVQNVLESVPLSIFGELYQKETPLSWSLTTLTGSSGARRESGRARVGGEARVVGSPARLKALDDLQRC